METKEKTEKEAEEDLELILTMFRDFRNEVAYATGLKPRPTSFTAQLQQSVQNILVSTGISTRPRTRFENLLDWVGNSFCCCFGNFGQDDSDFWGGGRSVQ
jgi:hypothetical protein